MREKLAEAERLLPFFHAECRMPNAECRIPNAKFRMLNSECRMLNSECRIPNCVGRIRYELQITNYLAGVERLLLFFRIAKAGFVGNSRLPANAGQSTGKSHFLPETIDIYTYIWYNIKLK